MECWLLLPLFSSLVAAQGSLVSNYNNILLCNSSIEKANASGTVTFESPLYWGNVSSPSWAVTVAQWNNVTQRTTWYNTAGRNYSNDLQLGFDACAYSFAYLPRNTIELGQDDPGDCSTTLSQGCRNALIQQTANIATGLTYTASPGPYSNLSAGSLPYICSEIWNALGYADSWPQACNQDFEGHRSRQDATTNPIQIGPLTSYNSSLLNGGCTLTSGDLTFHQVTTYDNTDTFVAYDDATSTIQPLLTVFMPVANVERTGGFGVAGTSLQCLRTAHFYPGSRVSVPLPSGTPYSVGLSGGAISGIVVGVVVFCALVGLAILFWLRRKRTASRTAALKQNVSNDSGSEIPEADCNEVLELSPVERVTEANGVGLIELSGRREYELP